MKFARTAAAGLAFQALFLTATLSTSAQADEGMWPFNRIPKERFQKDRNVALSDGWLDHVRLSSVRFRGGSGSFVSKTGLVLTNHHVGVDCISKLSRAGRDYVANGFIAGKDGPEARCPDVELNVLLAIEDVTDKVRAARKPEMNDAEANMAIKGAMTQIEKGCADRPSGERVKCEVVTLYAGGKYDLYTYKKYTDVRLVFAPEQSIAFFGGDTDNFTYPRYNFDMALFRVYENGQPLAPKDWLAWSPSGAKDGETVFVSGHPGSTGRLLTMAQLQTYRDQVYPYSLDQLRTERDRLRAYGKQNQEAARQVALWIKRLENSIKSTNGFLLGLDDPALMKKKAEGEAALRKAIEADPKLKQSHGTVFDELAAIAKKQTESWKRYTVLETGSRAQVLGIARNLVRLAAESEVPNEKRLREYNESSLESLKFRLVSPAPIYGEVEVVLVRAWLERAVRDLGAADPTVRALLAGRTPERAARETIAGSKLFDVNFRRKLIEGGKQAIAESADPAIAMMRALDPEARAVRKRYEDEVEGPSRTAGERIAQALFAVRGTSVPPDATSTLRLSVGTVKGFTERGKAVPWSTTFAGLYGHATGVAPLQLPERWLAAKSSLDPNVPYDFVSTNDIIGGNSGSPVLNEAGEIAGLIFDGNLSSLPNRFVYGDVTQRAVSVHTAGIVEALKKVYGADALAHELTDR
ncbi:S46 family peptidase [Pendulispora albinea]|uniref:Dipeptidyl-peptidase n=1 Tax=Pendulispora albinea TaxID=2741071 RepID=A0ABZ2MAW9_9BACT